MLLSNCISSSIDLYLYFICICIYLCICISLSKTYDGELLYGERGEEKFAPVSPHQLINHFANVFVKSHACGFQTDLPLIFVSSILPSLFFPHPCLSVPPPSCPIRTDDHQSLQNWKFPQNSASRRNLNSTGVT